MAPRTPKKPARKSAPAAQPEVSPSYGKSTDKMLNEMFAQDFELNQLRVTCGDTSELNGQSEPDFVKGTGWTPLEFLVATYRNPFQQMTHRIAAAKSVLEYAHRKLPTTLEVEGDVGVRQLDASALAKLSPKELDQLEALLNKASGGK